MDISIKADKETNRLMIELTGINWEECKQVDFYQGELKVQAIVADIGKELTKELMASKEESAVRIERAGRVYYQKGTASVGQYKTLYGDIELERHLYQTAHGGETICPLEQHGRMEQFGSATPLLAEVLAFKVSAMTAREVAQDLEKCHRVTAAPSYIAETAQTVGAIAVEKKESWTLRPTETDHEPVAVVATGMAGTTMPLVAENYKLAMVGTIAWYDADGERLGTEHIGAMPEEGKATFFRDFDRQVDTMLERHPTARHVVLCDGERTQWDHLEARYPNAIHLLDFWHAREHLAAAGDLIFGPEATPEKTAWYERQCHVLKMDTDGAALVLRELMRQRAQLAGRRVRAAGLDKELTYFYNNAHRMNYALYYALGFPIGSGVTEAACKTVIKQRFCRSGMKWKRASGGKILQLRVIRLSNQWDSFWFKVMRYVA